MEIYGTNWGLKREVSFMREVRAYCRVMEVDRGLRRTCSTNVKTSFSDT